MRLPSLIAAVLVLASPPTQAQETQRGRELYETHCLGCHYERIHKRDPARSVVRSFTQLRVEVVRRAEQTRRPFTVEDLDDMTNYLNRSHYRFER